MKKSILSVFFALLLNFCFSQSTDYQIKGILEDTLGNPLIYSTILLLEMDSTMVDFTRSEMDGSFKFDNVPTGNHLVKSTYVGYLPLTVNASSPDGENLDLGILKMAEIAEELMEVVIKAAKAPMKMRGDTIEYDASTFKVPEGSSVEDLLRRLPGIEIESDGSIQADGKDVSRVTVDGKSFFGSDPKAATKNLPAEGISKVQVFDTKTEEEEITGSTSESQDKTMNLELKEDFKSGGFGKVIAGIGDVDRKELKGNFNRFNKKIQFSIVGVGNNTGRNGLSWDDYQDFMGSQSFNFSDGTTDYGFGGGRNFYYFGGGGDDIEQSIQSVFFSGRQNNGFPENYNGGINFNYDHKKTKVSSVYYYNQAGLISESNRVADKFYQNFTQNEISDTDSDNTSAGHRVELVLEQELDSLHTLKIEFKGAAIDQNTNMNNTLSLSRDNVLTSGSTFENISDRTGNLLNGLLLFRKKFMKKGRRMGLNVSYLTSHLDDAWEQNSVTDFYDKDGSTTDLLNINQINDNTADKQLFKANALFVEPLSKRFFFQTFYNYRNRNETGIRNVTDIVNDQKAQNEFLSREYDNNISYNRVGSVLRYSHNGMNISGGIAYQSFLLQGEFGSLGPNGVTGIVDKTFTNVIPNLGINFQPWRNSYVSISFGRNASEPSIRDLQPLVDNINPLFVREGNSSLVPQLSNDINFYGSRSYPLSGVRISLSLNYSQFDNQFSTEETVDENLVTSVRPINIEGGSNGWANASLSFPFVKNKFTTRLRINLNQNARPTIVNGALNDTRTFGFSPSIKFNITPSQDMSLYITTGFNNANTTYDLNESQDQNTKTTNLDVEANSKTFAGIFVSTSLNYNRYRNDRFGLDQSIPIWNASIYKRILPDNKAELRLSFYDILNRNIGLYQGAFGLGISQTTTATLARYMMLSFTYNIRGMKSDVRKKSWW